MVLKDSIHHQEELILRTILETLETFPNDPAAINLAQQLGQLAPLVLIELLERENWRDRLTPNILQNLTPSPEKSSHYTQDYSPETIFSYLEPLIHDQNPLIPTAYLYIIAQLNWEQSQAIARDISPIQNSPLLQETAKIILSLSQKNPPLTTFPLLEKVVHLFNSDFFHRMHSETLITLAERAEIRTYSPNEMITEEGDTCRELLLLIEGDAKIHFYSQDNQLRTEKLRPGQTLDELEVLAHSKTKNTIIADNQTTRILAVPVDTFDDLLDSDRDFARRVLEMESQQLQRFMRSLQ
jgi:CRP-like cAMP-binding protein